MNPDRFEGLAGAFGANLDRWPARERQAALRLVAARPDLTSPLLREAARLDRILGGPPAPPPSRALLQRIVQAAPGRRSPPAPWRWLAGLGLAAGLAGAAAAGVAAGVVVAPVTLSSPHAQAASDPGEEAAALLREPSDFGEG